MPDLLYLGSVFFLFLFSFHFFRSAPAQFVFEFVVKITDFFSGKLFPNSEIFRDEERFAAVFGHFFLYNIVDFRVAFLAKRQLWCEDKDAPRADMMPGCPFTPAACRTRPVGWQ